MKHYRNSQVLWNFFTFTRKFPKNLAETALKWGYVCVQNIEKSLILIINII